MAARTVNEYKFKFKSKRSIYLPCRAKALCNCDFIINIKTHDYDLRYEIVHKKEVRTAVKKQRTVCTRETRTALHCLTFGD